VAPRGGPAGVHPPFGRVTGGGRRGAKTAGTTPATGCATPPGGVGVERRRETYLIVAPSLRNDHDLVPRAEIGGFSPRSAGAPPKRGDGATMRYVSLRCSTPTPPGGVAHPVVGVVPAVLAPRRPPPVTLPNGVWTTPRGHKISAITHTTRNIDCNGYKSHSVADVSLN
jgi:hypothetical protein